MSGVLGTLGCTGRGRPCSKDWVALSEGGTGLKPSLQNTITETLLFGPWVLSSHVLLGVLEQSGRQGAEMVSFSVLICAPQRLQNPSGGKLNPSVASTPLRIFFFYLNHDTAINQVYFWS